MESKKQNQATKLGYYWIIKHKGQQVPSVARLSGNGWLFMEDQATTKMIGGARKVYEVLGFIAPPGLDNITPEMVQEAYNVGRVDGVNALTAMLSKEMGVPYEEVSMADVDKMTLSFGGIEEEPNEG